MWVGTIALIGFWPLSKDAILAGALHGGATAGWIVYVGGLVGAAFTGIYATRLMRLVFYGEMSDFAKEHLHAGHGEAPWTMFLAGGGAGGRCGAGRVPVDRLRHHRTSSATSSRRPRPRSRPPSRRTSLTTGLAWGLGSAGALYVWRLYDDPARVAAVRSRFQTHGDHRRGTSSAGTSSTTTSPTARRCGWPSRSTASVERWIIGGSLWLARTTVATLARATALAQSGIVRQYATVLAGGAARGGRVLPREGEPVTVALIALPLVAPC